jgi:hypothetical protein
MAPRAPVSPPLQPWSDATTKPNLTSQRAPNSFMTMNEW